MSFLIRSVDPQDLESLFDLAEQFSLLNLPADKSILTTKIENSVMSFAGDQVREKAEYIFVVEDIENRKIVGSSQIIAKHGTDETPHYYFEVGKTERFSEDLGIGFIHQVLRLGEDSDGPTEIGGLLVDRHYRRRSEKLGQQISLIRFLYIGMHLEKFEERLLCELTPPLTDEGRSEFWEALGRRFTGLNYQEADLISQQHKEFIRKLFPQEDIYMCLLDSKARLVLGRVGEDTRPAQHLLEKIGFRYLNHVDPFDGGPHLGVATREVSLIKTGGLFKVSKSGAGGFSQWGFIGLERDGKFLGARTPYQKEGKSLVLPANTFQILELSENEEVYFSAP